MQQGCNLRILMSNHDINFIMAVQKAKTKEELIAIINDPVKNEFFKKHNQGISFMRLLKSLEKNEISFEDVQAMAGNYFSTLVLLDYSLDTTTGELKLYSHAPVNLNDLRKLGDQLGVAYPGDDCTHADRIEFIKQVNQVFRTLLLSGNTDVLEGLFSEGSAANGVIWRREKDHTFIPKSKKIINVYGHDKSMDHVSNVIRLDNSSGKGNLVASEEMTSYECKEGFENSLAYDSKAIDSESISNFLPARRILAIKDFNKARALLYNLIENTTDLNRQSIYRNVINNFDQLNQRMEVLKDIFGNSPVLPMVAVGLADQALLRELKKQVTEPAKLSILSSKLEEWGYKDEVAPKEVAELKKADVAPKEVREFRKEDAASTKVREFLRALGVKDMPAKKVAIGQMSFRELDFSYTPEQFSNAMKLSEGANIPLLEEIKGHLIQQQQQVRDFLEALGVKKIPAMKVARGELSFRELDFSYTPEQFSNAMKLSEGVNIPLLEEIKGHLIQQQQQVRDFLEVLGVKKIPAMKVARGELSFRDLTFSCTRAQLLEAKKLSEKTNIPLLFQIERHIHNQYMKVTLAHLKETGALSPSVEEKGDPPKPPKPTGL